MPAVKQIDRGREIGGALGTLGFLLPLLAGGNVFALLSAEDGTALFGLVAVFVAGAMVRDRIPPPGDDRRFSTWWANASLLVLVVWWGGVLFLRPHGPRAVLEARGVFAAALLFASLSHRRLRSETLWTFVRGLLLGTLVTVLYGQYQYWIAFPRTLPLLKAAGIPAVTLVNANFYNANCYAAFLSATILLVAGLVSVVHGWRRWLTAAGLVPLAATLLLSESRSAVALLVLAALGWAALRIAPGRRRSVGSSLVFRVSAVLSALSLIILVGLVDLRELWRVGLLGRISIWQGSLAMIRDHWIFGVGLGRFWVHYPLYRVTNYYTRYPHSFLLEILAELGVVGGAAIGAFLAAAAVAPLRMLVRLREAAPSDRRWALASVAIACAVLATHALVDIDWHAPANPILLFVLLGFAQHLPDGREGDA